jgi:hypothetical protein
MMKNILIIILVLTSSCTTIKKEKLTPNLRYMKRGETKSFTVSGVSPYTARVVDGDGILSPGTQSDDGRFIYIAGNVADKDIIIEFSDNSGQTVPAHVYVERKLRLICFHGQRMLPIILPSTVVMAAGETKTFMRTRGTGPYEWTF